MHKKGNLLVLGLMVIGLLAACAPAAAPGSPEQVRTLNVNGSGQVTLVPDIATINVGVRTEADSVTDALDGNTAQANAVADVLKDMGIDEKDIQTSNFNIYPNQRYDNMSGEPQGTFYVVENTVSVTVRDISQLGEVLSAVVDAGASNIYGINFNVEDREAAVAEARKLAIEDAKAKAAEIAHAAGVSVGEILSINVFGGGSPVAAYDMKGGMGEGSVPISAGSLVISMECSLTYEIK
jgi:uncharacterized protein